MWPPSLLLLLLLFFITSEYRVDASDQALAACAGIFDHTTSFTIAAAQGPSIIQTLPVIAGWNTEVEVVGSGEDAASTVGSELGNLTSQQNATGKVARAVVVWQANTDGSGYGIYASLLDWRSGVTTAILRDAYQNRTAGVGSAAGAHPHIYADRFLVNTAILYDQINPNIATFDAGFIILFQTTIDFPTLTGGNASINPKITRVQRMHFQLYDRFANRVGSESDAAASPGENNSTDLLQTRQDAFGVLTSLPGFQNQIAILWASFPIDPTNGTLLNANGTIYARKMNGHTGQALSKPTTVNTFATATYAQMNVAGLSLTPIGADRLLAMWPASPTGLTVYWAIQWLDADDLTPIGMEARLNRQNGGTLSDPVAKDVGDGRALVTWTFTAINTGNINPQTVLQSQLLNSRLARQGREYVFNGGIASSSPSDADLVSLKSNQSTLLLWNAYISDYQAYQVYGALVNTTGTPLSLTGDPFLVDETVVATTSDVLDVLPDGTLLGEKFGPVVVWSQNNQGIQGRLLHCPHDCTYSEWTPWSNCTNTCGTGSQTRSRRVLTRSSAEDGACQGPVHETRACVGFDCLNCDDCIGETCYLLAHNGSHANRNVGLANCDRSPGCLLKPSDPLATCLATVATYGQRYFLATAFSGRAAFPAWIASYGNGTTDLNICMVLGPKGEIVVPGKGCNAQRPALCQVPKPKHICP